MEPPYTEAVCPKIPAAEDVQQERACIFLSCKCGFQRASEKWKCQSSLVFDLTHSDWIKVWCCFCFCFHLFHVEGHMRACRRLISYAGSRRQTCPCKEDCVHKRRKENWYGKGVRSILLILAVCMHSDKLGQEQVRLPHGLWPSGGQWVAAVSVAERLRS